MLKSRTAIGLSAKPRLEQRLLTAKKPGVMLTQLKNNAGTQLTLPQNATTLLLIMDVIHPFAQQIQIFLIALLGA